MPVDQSCPVCRTAEIVCGKWTLLLVRELAEGRSRFCELERTLTGISPRTLSLRLRALEEEGIVERQTFPEVPPRGEGAVTHKGARAAPDLGGQARPRRPLAGPAVRERAGVRAGRARRSLTPSGRRSRAACRKRALSCATSRCTPRCPPSP